ncbi:MAG: putative esterase YcpF (UPF0227 family) [Alphaproteobacteria bacterium]|jgi:predicted esterase YcpF (UPF0227 family)
MHHLVYLHGFLSSPQSVKAQQTICFAKKHFPSLNLHVPQLPGDVHKALKIIDNLVATLPLQQTGFIGSSMGGFLSTYCIEKYSIKDHATAQASTTNRKLAACPKAVLVNPAVEPFELLRDYLGQHVNEYTNEVFHILPQHIVKLRQLFVNKLADPSRYKVLLQKGDETLDYKLAAKKYAYSNLVVEEGGDHSFVNYEAHLPRIFRFLFS